MPNEEEFKALLDSISHWKENVKKRKQNKPILTGADNCACCQLQKKRQEKSHSFECFHETGDCLIANFTRYESCSRTPYYSVTAGEIEPAVMVKWLQQLYDYLKDLGKSPQILEEDNCE